MNCCKMILYNVKYINDNNHFPVAKYDLNWWQKVSVHIYVVIPHVTQIYLK